MAERRRPIFVLLFPSLVNDLLIDRSGVNLSDLLKARKACLYKSGAFCILSAFLQSFVMTYGQTRPNGSRVGLPRSNRVCLSFFVFYFKTAFQGIKMGESGRGQKERPTSLLWVAAGHFHSPCF